jgi:hypothetical protein
MIEAAIANGDADDYVHIGSLEAELHANAGYGFDLLDVGKGGEVARHHVLRLITAAPRAGRLVLRRPTPVIHHTPRI